VSRAATTRDSYDESTVVQPAVHGSLIGQVLAIPAPAPQQWSLQIFRMTSHWRQQRVLQILARVGMPGVHALGVVRADGHFVIVDAACIAEEVRSRRLVLKIDPSSRRVVVSTPRRRRGEAATAEVSSGA